MQLHDDSSERKPSPRGHLTHVELFWQGGVREHWLRFGRQAGDRIIDRRRRVASFAPAAIFAFIRWAANDYGTVSSQIDIVRAVSRGEAFSTLPHVDPGGEIFLHLHGWPKVEQVLCAIDAIEATRHRARRRCSRSLAAHPQPAFSGIAAAQLLARTPSSLALA